MQVNPEFFRLLPAPTNRLNKEKKGKGGVCLCQKNLIIKNYHNQYFYHLFVSNLSTNILGFSTALERGNNSNIFDLCPSAYKLNVPQSSANPFLLAKKKTTPSQSSTMKTATLCLAAALGLVVLLSTLDRADAQVFSQLKEFL